MRRRLLLGGLGVVVLTLLLFAVPLGVVLRSQVVDSELDGFAARLEQTATLIDERSRTCAEVQVTLSALAREDVRVTVFDRDGTARFVQAGDLASGEVPRPGSSVEQAAGGSTGQELREGRPVVAVPLSTTVCGERLVLQGIADGEPLAARVRRTWWVLGLAALAALAVGAAAAMLAGRRLSRPLEELAGSARRLGEGDFTARAPRSGLAEPDEIADALDQTADRLGRAVARGTAFAADASHQLRTPLTALRLHLEAARLGVEDQDRLRSLDDATAEADRLAATIDELVALTRADGDVVETDVAALVAARAAPWEARAAAVGRRLRVETAPVRPCELRPAALAQALEVLVDNALRHGDGDVAVTVAPSTPAERTAAVRVVVSDQGPGLPDGSAVLGDRSDRGGLPVHGGRGLPLARDLVEGEGGRLVLASEPGAGTRATVVLPIGGG